MATKAALCRKHTRIACVVSPAELLCWQRDTFTPTRVPRVANVLPSPRLGDARLLFPPFLPPLTLRRARLTGWSRRFARFSLYEQKQGRLLKRIRSSATCVYLSLYLHCYIYMYTSMYILCSMCARVVRIRIDSWPIQMCGARYHGRNSTGLFGRLIKRHRDWCLVAMNERRIVGQKKVPGRRSCGERLSGQKQRRRW